MKKLLFFLLFPTGLYAQRCCDLSSMQLPGISTLTVIGSFSSFSTTSGNASASQSVTISGSNLSANVSLTLDGGATGFEISKDGGSTYATSQTVTISGGSIPSQPLAIFVRIAATASIGTPSGNLIVASTGASTVNVPLSGTITGASSAHWRALPIPSSSVIGGSDLTNFTAELTINGAYLATVANGGKVQNSNGYDITLSLDNAGSSLLNWEIESWNPVSGALVVWVKIPTLSASTTTTIYLRYGSSSISTFQGGSPGSAWDGNTVRAWHFSENITGAGQTIKDFSANAGNMTSVGSWVTGQSVAGISGKALKVLSSTATYMTYSTINLTGNYTIEGWFNVASGTVDGNTWSWDFDGGLFQNSMAWGAPDGYAGLFMADGSKIQDGSPATGAVFQHFVFTRTGTSWIMYKNGVQTATSSQAENVQFNTMCHDGGFTSNDIIIDEPRLYNVVRTPGWIGTEYGNQNSNATWFSIGAEN